MDVRRKKMKRITALFIGVLLSLSVFSLIGCKDKGNSSTQSEETWSDENVDDNGWT